MNCIVDMSTVTQEAVPQSRKNYILHWRMRLLFEENFI